MRPHRPYSFGAPRGTELGASGDPKREVRGDVAQKKRQPPAKRPSSSKSSPRPTSGAPKSAQARQPAVPKPATPTTPAQPGTTDDLAINSPVVVAAPPSKPATATAPVKKTAPRTTTPRGRRIIECEELTPLDWFTLAAS